MFELEEPAGSAKLLFALELPFCCAEGPDGGPALAVSPVFWWAEEAAASPELLFEPELLFCCTETVLIVAGGKALLLMAGAEGRTSLRSVIELELENGIPRPGVAKVGD